MLTFQVPGTEPGAVSHAIVVVPQDYGLKSAGDNRDTGKRYPVVYLLHGYGANHTHWYVRSRDAGRPLSTYADRYGVILVSVDGKYASWYLDAFPDSEDPVDWQVETTITKHLIPAVDARYRTWADPRGRGVTGLSMGGHGALYLAARHPELFSACGVMSGLMDLTHVVNRQNLQRRLGRLEQYPERWREHSAATQAEQLAGRRVGLLLDCGWSDPFFEDHRLLHEKLTRLQIAHEFFARPGGHDWPYWINALPYHLQFISDRLKPAGVPLAKPAAGTPFTGQWHTVQPDPAVPADARDLDIADFNNDGKPDVAVAWSGGIAWFENPSWKRHLISDESVRNPVSLAAEDIDRDGRADVVLACAAGDVQRGGELLWLRNGASAPWQRIKISAGTDLRCIRWAEVDADGRRELLAVQQSAATPTAPSGESRTRVLVMHVPAQPEKDLWPTTSAGEPLRGCAAIRPLRFFAAPFEQFLTASAEGIAVFSREPATGAWTVRSLGAGHPKTPNSGTRDVTMGQLRGGPRFLAAVEPAEGRELVVYLEPPFSSGLWRRVVVDDTPGNVHGVACADLNGDGDDEIVVGVGGPDDQTGVKIYCASTERADRWTGGWLDRGGIAPTAIRVGDVNGDRRPDIIAAGGPTRNLKLYLSAVAGD